RMYGRDDKVELREAVVGEIQSPVGEDVALDACKQREAVESIVEGADARGMPECPCLVEAVSHGERTAMVGNGDVVTAGATCAIGHRLEVVPAVGLRRVHVEIAEQV